MTTVIRGMKTEAEKALILSKTEEEEEKMSEQKTQAERSFEEARVKLEQMIAFPLKSSQLDFRNLTSW